MLSRILQVHHSTCWTMKAHNPLPSLQTGRHIHSMLHQISLMLIDYYFFLYFHKGGLHHVMQEGLTWDFKCMSQILIPLPWNWEVFYIPVFCLDGSFIWSVLETPMLIRLSRYPFTAFRAISTILSSICSIIVRTSVNYLCVVESGASNPSGMRGCQRIIFHYFLLVYYSDFLHFSSSPFFSVR